MAKVTVKCALCGKAFRRSESQARENNFCCKAHYNEWNSRRISEYNRTDNPMNKPSGVLASRIKRSRKLSGTGEGKSYPKLLEKHAHRRIAESKLGRPLKKGEVVHHVDGNKLNNDPENLKVLPSQSEHCKFRGFGKKKGG